MKIRVPEGMRLLHTTPLSPIYKLHPTIDIISKPNANREAHCNRWDAFGQRRCFNDALQSVYDLISSIGRYREENT